jgi:hypothetical protein
MSEQKLRTARSMKILINKWLKSNHIVANVSIEYHVIFFEHIAFLRMDFQKTLGVSKTINYMINMNSPQYMGRLSERHIIELLENTKKGLVIK